MNINLRSIKAKLLIYSTTIILFTFISFIFAVIYVESEGSIKSAEDFEHMLFITIPILFLLMVSLAWFILNRVLKKVQTIIDEVASIKTGDLTTRLSIRNTNDELDDLIITFNNMLDKIEQSVQKIKRFSNDVSHELKTPLTVIIGELELGLRKQRTIDEYKNILNTSLEETKILKELIDNLLLLSNMDKQNLFKKFELIDLDELIIDIISHNQVFLEEKNIKVDFKDFENVQIKGNTQLLKVMLSNIIQNSIKYSNKDSKIEITLKNNICIIKDYGIGIKQEYLSKVFDRFYRVDESRARGGYGLGLSIVKDIAKLHNININITSKYKEYTQVEFKI